MIIIRGSATRSLRTCNNAEFRNFAKKKRRITGVSDTNMFRKIPSSVAACFPKFAIGPRILQLFPIPCQRSPPRLPTSLITCCSVEQKQGRTQDFAFNKSNFDKSEVVL